MTARGELRRDVRRLRRRCVVLLDQLAVAEPIEALGLLGELRETGDQLRQAIVHLALYDGASWRQAAAALGEPLATVHRQYGPWPDGSEA